MARKLIDIGTVGNDGTGDSIRDSFRKVNDNFRELYSSLGLGEKLTFIGLSDAPSEYLAVTPVTNNTAIVTVNNLGSGVTFKRLIEGDGISLDFNTLPNDIIINSKFSRIVGDTAPQLGGNLSLQSGTDQFRIIDAGTNIDPLLPIYAHELVNKAYADSKVSRFGTNAVDPSLGRMSGPLILSRDPEPDDDVIYDGLIAATKRYVDNSAFGSSVNLYVALSGEDERIGVSPALQGRALAYAYRTLEAALKRAEELVLEAPLQIGPYKKVLTYNNGAGTCTLDNIEISPLSGTGFAGILKMSLDTFTINNGGVYYYPGDVLEIQGGTVAVGGNKATIQVLSTATTPGEILTFRVLSTGVYTALPNSSQADVKIIESAAPVEIGPIGDLAPATFDLTFKVNSVEITDGGSGYSLVSVRISGGSGTGAFGTAVVSSGSVVSITITDKGTGFTSLPSLNVNLPRFLLVTEDYGTDFTGDVTTSTPEAIRGRDIREGLYLRGETSGALAQIVSHQGLRDSEGREIFDVDVKSGSFIDGEIISYGDISKNIQLCVLVESGEYYENYPLKVPANVSIVGDEFRRVIFRPKPGASSSPWAFQKFRRDLVIDGITVSDAENEFAHHYLGDPNIPVYPAIDNPGDFTAAAGLLSLNRTFFQEEIIAWIDNNSENNVLPFADTFSYNRILYKRDIGLLIDSIIFDLKYGVYNRTVSAAIKYYQTEHGLKIINSQLFEYLQVLIHLDELMQDVITNTEITVVQTLFPQIIDQAFQSEVGSGTVITTLIDIVKDVLDESAPGFGSVNQPKENQELDVFLANDAVRWQALSAIGHGGFMGVLDPEGQILSRSPYFQECASFSRSKDRQVFAGGMFVDGFVGNLEFNIDAVITTTRISVSGLIRFPETPSSFIVAGDVYRINYVRDFVYDKDGSSATFILDETTPWPYNVFTYNSAACYRDTGLILEGLGYDIAFGSNYWTRLNGSTYRLAQSIEVINNQRSITLEAITYAHQLASTAVGGYPNVQTIVNLSNATISDIIDRGVSAIPTLTFTLPADVTTNVSRAYTLLMANRNYIVAEVDGYIKAQIAGNISPWATGDTYNVSRLQSNTLVFVEAVVHDLIYGGNRASRVTALKYYNNLTGEFLVTLGQETRFADAMDWANTVAQAVVINTNPASVYSALARTTGTAASAAEQTIINGLFQHVIDSILAADYTDAQAAITEVLPSVTTSSYNANNVAARIVIQDNKVSIQTAVIDYVDLNGNRYEVLMPGNRSMLANDHTQVNDMGYGAIAMNGGLIELVSMFTYYCYTSYYSVTGGQIRSVGGSSAHGIYALVAEGADPLEVPTPTTIYQDFSQRVLCYYPTPTYANVPKGLLIYVYGYDYEPLGGAELEIDHSGVIFRYPVSSASVTGLPPGVSRLNLSTGTGGTSEGLFATVLADTKMTLRANSQVLLTGNLQDVAVRPSTGLKLRETADNVYRVLQFTSTVDTNGPYELSIVPGSPGLFRVLETITDIDTNLCTTVRNHKLKVGEKFIPTSTSNGLFVDTTYYVIEVPAYNQFKLSLSPGGSVETLVNGSGLSIKGIKNHKILENYTVSFTTTGTLPAAINDTGVYWVLSTDLTETEFTISDQKNGTSIDIASIGTGVHSYNIEGLTLTNLRENYNYVDLTIQQPGEYISAVPNGTVCTISVASPAVISLTGHGFSIGDVVKFTTTGNLPTGLAQIYRYFVISAGFGPDNFQVSLAPGGTAADTSGSQSGTHSVGLVTGRAGDDTFSVVPVGSQDISRVAGSRFVFLGEEYAVSVYAPESVTNQPYARVTLDRPLVDSINSYASSYTIKSAVPTRFSGSLGTLTIRISLTRVTSHDLLEIGTGSYADTNYPKEIYGPSVNTVNPDTETEERDVGRCFYVTTDQFGNFSVGPYFRVDQGTGQVTFSSSIALSNLDGIGFKRGVPIAEFSTDSGFTDNATDTVPTENATRIYIERRLGITHDGSVVIPEQRIPSLTGGFLSLDGQSSMLGNLDVGNNKIVNLDDPTGPNDAVNLQSLTFDNIQDITIVTPSSGDLLAFTGTANQSGNVTITGDITATSVAGNLNLQIASNSIVNADVNASAAILQSKLAMTTASTRLNSVGITQADLGLASFDLTRFISTNGWLQLRDTTIVRFNGYIIGTTLTVVSISAGTMRTENIVLGTSVSIGTTVSSQLTGTIGGVGTYTVSISQTVGSISSPSSMTSYNTSVTGVTTSNIQIMTAKSVLGNSEVTAANASEVAFNDVVDKGDGIKKVMYSGTGFLKRTDTASLGYLSDGNYTVTNSSAGSSSVVGANDLIQRNSSGDFGGRTIDVQSVKVDNQLAIDSVLAATATASYIRYYGYDSQGGILIQSGTAPGDDTTSYWNDTHVFKTQNGVSLAPIQASSIQVTAITTGGNLTNGEITGRWKLTGASPNESRLEATYAADLAEYYEGDQDYEVGTVLVFGGDKEVTVEGKLANTRVAGVVSNTAGFVMYDACPGLKNLVALQGRVPCKVVGKIRKGDLMVTSNTPGIAVSAGEDARSGAIIGKALENYDSDHIGMIEVAVGRT